MKRNVKIHIFLCFCLILGFLASCAPKAKEPQARSYFDWFDTASTVYSYAEDGEEAFLANCKAVAAVLEDYHRLFDIYYEYSGVNNLCTVNRNAGKAPVKVDVKLIDFLEYAKELYTLTGGELNIAMGSVLFLWHNARTEANDGGEALLPDPSVLSEAAEHTDISSLIINREEGTVYISDPQMRIDVGALGKGYAVERAAEALYDRGVTGYVLNIGGNVRCIGERPSVGGWITGITNPDKESDEPFACRVTLKNVSCVTSGDYERFFTVDGKRYHHIIDKDTLMPAEHFSLVTVITEDSGLADGLSTALLCMSYEDGLALLSQIKNAEAMWITPDGEKYMTSGFEALIVK
ncbi:MAG: FAD:protein FMN transferase [Clostridia bacterium]|nr:FAD:protein FMN transferase [Clostridia bacterium]